MNQYQIEQVQTDDNSLMRIQECLCLSFPKSNKFTLEFLQWQYRDNPVGEIIGFNAISEDGVIAAHYVAMPIYMLIDGRKSKGLLSLNTATHPHHRGRGLFSLLAQKTYDYAANAGYEYVIGVANANSTHGFIKNLGFELVCPLMVRFGCGKASIEKKFLYERYWDERTLEWRLSCPNAEYYKKDNFLYSKRSYGRKDILGIIDSNTISLPTPHINFRPISLYVGIGAKLSGIMIKLPKFIKISPFNLIFKDLTGGKLPQLNKDNILFQLMDYDVV